MSSTSQHILKSKIEHGRVKVKSTIQQEEEKRKEREKKLKVFVSARDAVFKKRSAGENDEEALQLTQQLLSSNPDFATLWNYRREILMHLETLREKDDVQKLFETELNFIEGCLKVNPKSYGSWHHRTWVTERMPRPDWTRELGLCDRCLSLDERNFHCWDYRRMVVKVSGVSVEQELQFTDRLIGSNFSNYSSWHYRSTLLPQLHPQSASDSAPNASSSHTASPQTHSHRVCEEQLLTEYELVHNAFFTDPNDQSSWFYYRWLLGRGVRESETVAVAFSKPDHVLSVGLMLVLDGQPLQLCDLPAGCISNINNEHNLTIHWTKKQTRKDCGLFTGSVECWCRDSATDQELFRSELSVEKTTVLQAELQSCNQLLELEPQNKWCLLTIILLMRALDPLGHEKETLAHFQTLKEVDPMRSSYYSDLCSKFLIENTILKMEYAEVRVFSLSNKNLTTLCHLDQLLLVTHINLSSNQLVRLPPQFAMLRCLEVLEADDNAIENLEGVYNLPKLEEISLKNNLLASCPKLTRVDLHGNPVSEIADLQSQLAQLLPMVTSLSL
ncbi:Geranylgeranyl transferase type-2 subunit alpha [Triplophysa tibetana]|uniref:Geranylgeranyl transferase type-2 subunit alpha n=1 Tax=Triplophysa tibetana TaxID=1572043 RepID=A0A5A9NC18_9TELE|nr:Geranylgeranyl transferase type-2 subunit alpha [Triplophysa tibetana]